MPDSIVRDSLLQQWARVRARLGNNSVRYGPWGWEEEVRRIERLFKEITAVPIPPDAPPLEAPAAIPEPKIDRPAFRLPEASDKQMVEELFETIRRSGAVSIETKLADLLFLPVERGSPWELPQTLRESFERFVPRQGGRVPLVCPRRSS